MNSLANSVITSYKKVETFKRAHRLKVRAERRARRKVLEIASKLFIALLLVVGVTQIPTIVQTADVNQFNNLQDEFDIVEFNIGYGDTAWDIQKEFLPGENLNELMHHLPKLNGGQFPSTLKAGQTYYFFVEKEGN